MTDLFAPLRIQEAARLIRQYRAAETAGDRRALRDDLDQLLATMSGSDIAAAQAQAFGLAEVSLARQLCA